MRQQQSQMQTGQLAPQMVASQFRRQAETGSDILRSAIVKQAQTLDAQGQQSQFFYNSTIQQATAVTKALKARFTYVPESTSSKQETKAPVVLDDEASPAGDQNGAEEEAKERIDYRLETNLVTFASNVLKVYSLPNPSDDLQTSVDLRLSTQFNGRILDVIRVPTEPFLKDEQAQQPIQRKHKNVVGSKNAAAAETVTAGGGRSNRRKQRDIEQQMIDTTDQHKQDGDEVKQVLIKDAPDYLFVILANFAVALICYNKAEQRIEVVSRGNISEKILHDQKEPPYPIFLGQTGKFIVLMLYNNILKVIPLVLRNEPSNPHICTLTHATAVRVCHSNVMQVVPLFNEGSMDHQTFGVLYQKTDHVRVPGVVGPPALSIKVELEKQLFDIDRRDLTPLEKNGGKLEFISNSVYRVEPLSFGGFLVFDLDTVSYHRNGLLSNSGAYHEQLKSVHTITAFCQVDDYDELKGKTATDSPFVRFLFATEAGELFMLAMHCETLGAVLRGDGLDQAESLINIEFLASKLTFCSSLVYLDDSLIFYSSKEGDSFILKICAEHQGNQDQPYVSIEQRFTSLAPIMDMQLARPENTQGQQSELVIVGGWNHQTNMNMVKQGVGLRSVKSFESVLPADMVQEFFVASDKVFMRMFGYDQLIGMQIKKQKYDGSQSSLQGDVINVDGFDVSRNFAVKASEQILALTSVTINQKTQQKQQSEEKEGEGDGGEEQQMQVDAEEQKTQKVVDVVVYATENRIIVTNQSGEEQFGSKVYCELKPIEGRKFTLVSVKENIVIAVQQDGLIQQCKLMVSEDGSSVSLTEVSKIEMMAEISALCISTDSQVIDILYVTLYDAPHYSLNVLSLAQNEQEIKLLARLPLASILNMLQTKKFYQHQLVKNGQVFSQFNHSKEATMLQDLPASTAVDQPKTDERMEVDATAKVQSSQQIAMQFNCTAGRSIESLTIKSQKSEMVMIGFETGKILQICIDLIHLRSILTEPATFAPFLDFKKYVESRLNVENQELDAAQVETGQHEDLNIEHNGPFWGAQASYVGTILPKMRKIQTELRTEAIIACSDRPVVFYEANESIEMHYLAYRQIRDIAYVAASSTDQTQAADIRPLLMYEDSKGVLHLSENDNLRRLQVQRMVFKMQISKTLLVPSNDAIVVLLEQPNMDYIDNSKPQACNVVALVSRSTMRTQAIFTLQKSEIANCAQTIDLDVEKQNTRQSARKWLLVGTAFLNPEETIPSMGRILMLDATTMELVQEFQTAGSVQSILLSDLNKFLLLAVNNQIQAYDFATFMPTLRANSGTIQRLGKLDLLCQKSSGTFIQSIVKLISPSSSRTLDGLAESIIVGDMTGRGISTFELKPCRLSQVKIVESASTHISLWVNSIVALSDSQFIVFDNDGNLFIFQKNLYPTCIEEKLKLSLKGSYCIGEEVQSAVFGSLRSTTMQQEGHRLEKEQIAADELKTRQKKKQYVDSNQMMTNAVQSVQNNIISDPAANVEMAAAEDKKEDQVMIVTRGSVAKQNQQSKESELALEVNDTAQFSRILKDWDFARRFATKTLEEMFILQAQKCSIVYGTTDGSIGSLFQITPKVYLLLQLLQHELDQHVNLDLVSQKRSEYRAVKQTPATSTELQTTKNITNGIIDGDLVEIFLDLPKNKKMDFARGMLGQAGKGDEIFTEYLTQIVSLMKKTH